MIAVDERMELAGNEYYRVFCFLSEREGVGKWLAKIRVIRKDTDEYVNAGFTIFDDEKKLVIENATTKINASLMPALEEMGAPPDWDSEVRRVLVCCKKLHSNIVQFGSDCADIIASQGDVDEFWIKYPKFWKQLIKESIALSQRIEMLSTQERIDLLVSPDNVFEDPSDSWSLEDLDSRIMVFDYFANSTTQEKIVHEAQKKKLADRFEELGWD